MEGNIVVRTLAFLVDGDNASAALIPEMLAEASKYGSVIIRRVYGDWTSSQLQPWKEVLQEYALTPEQQFANVSGKNATDSSMIIDAMDILHSKVVGGFCLVSSDSDYTRLATRIREAGLFVMGIGAPQTPAPFRRACDVFVSTENLRSARVAPVLRRGSPGTRVRATVRIPSEAVNSLERAFDGAAGDDGLAPMASIGEILRRLDPAFDPRTYGHSKLVDLVEALPDIFQVVRKKELGPGAVYVKRKGGG
jgi:hypothetical protein